MTVSTGPRTGVTRWSAGSDPVTRAQFDASHAALEAGAVMATMGTLAARPAASAANAKTFYQDETGILYWSNGTTWVAVGAGTERQYTNAAATGTVTLDLTAYDTFRLTAVGNVTIALSNPPPVGTAKRFVLRFIQDAAVGRTLTLPASMQPDGGTAPTLNTGANTSTSIEARTTDAGTSYQYRVIWQSAPPVAASQTFNYTAAAQTVVVPAGRTMCTFDLRGAAGGSVTTNGGMAGREQGTIAVTAGETLQINVGGAGSYGVTDTNTIAAGGFNGGGSGHCSGGGATDIRRSPNALANRLAVAGGGGGSGANSAGVGAGGGGGGGYFGGGGAGANSTGTANGTNGVIGVGGNGGTTTTTPSAVAAGAAGGNGGGVAGVNGANGYSVGGGGGTASAGGVGTVSVGGGPGSGAGGGGSGFTDPSATGVAHTVGVQSGNGVAVLTWS